jgi:hypothetical protein
LTNILHDANVFIMNKGIASSSEQRRHPLLNRAHAAAYAGRALLSGEFGMARHFWNGGGEYKPGPVAHAVEHVSDATAGFALKAMGAKPPEQQPVQGDAINVLPTGGVITAGTEHNPSQSAEHHSTQQQVPVVSSELYK